VIFLSRLMYGLRTPQFAELIARTASREQILESVRALESQILISAQPA